MRLWLDPAEGKEVYTGAQSHCHVYNYSIASSGYGNGVPHVQHSCIPSSMCEVRSATGVLLTAAVHSRRHPDSQKASHVDYLPGVPA